MLSLTLTSDLTLTLDLTLTSDLIEHLTKPMRHINSCSWIDRFANRNNLLNNLMAEVEL